MGNKICIYCGQNLIDKPGYSNLTTYCPGIKNKTNDYQTSISINRHKFESKIKLQVKKCFNKYKPETETDCQEPILNRRI